MSHIKSSSRFFLALNDTDKKQYQSLSIPDLFTVLPNPQFPKPQTEELRVNLLKQVMDAKTSLVETQLYSKETYVHELVAKEMLIRIIYDRKGVADEEIDQLEFILNKYDQFVAKENSVRCKNREIDQLTGIVAVWTGALLITASSLVCLFLINPAATLGVIDGLLNINGAGYPVVFVLGCLIVGLGMLTSSPIIKLLGVLGCMEKHEEIERHAPAVGKIDENHRQFISALREIKKQEYDELFNAVELPTNFLETIKTDARIRLAELQAVLGEEYQVKNALIS